MILLFLGSWRSTLIVAVSIPLSILSSIVVLYAAGPLAQRDDARRPGAGGRHPGRRRDGRDREHPPQPRPGQAAAAGDPRRRHADRRADVRLDADDLHRVRLGAVPRRPAEVPVHAAGPGRGVRHAGLVPAVADAGADDGRLPAAGRAARTATAPATGWFGRLHAGVRAPLRAVPRRLRRAAGVEPAAPPRPCSRSSRLVVASGVVAAAVRRPGLLPDGRRGPVPPARPRPGRHAARGDRALLQRGRGRDPRDHSRATKSS